MYFPYLRGKTFELLALREFAEQESLSKYISPIIEPVTNNMASLKRACETLVAKNVNFNIILNPKVGAFAKVANSVEIISDFAINNKLSIENNFQFAFLLNADDDYDNVLNIIEKLKSYEVNITLIHNYLNDNVDIIEAINNNQKVVYNVIDLSKTSPRYYRKFNKGSLITLTDGFNSKKVNSQYSDNTDEFFSEEYKYYKDDGYFGFADYLTIGDNYSEGGFLPYAVVIHLTYEENGQIRVHHSVSDTNEDATDTAGKFSEALSKLVVWVENKGLIKTKAIYQFEELNLRERFPGLGYIKKLSILNHLELMGRVLEDESL